MDYGGKRRGEKKKERKKKKAEMWQVVSETCERNKKNKCFMYLSIGGIKVMCILSFTFEGNCGTNLKALLKYMNR